MTKKLNFFWQKTKTFIFTKIDKNHLFFYKKPEIPSNSSANPIFGGFWEDPFFDPKKGLFILESSMYIAFYTSILGTKKWKNHEFGQKRLNVILPAPFSKKWVKKWHSKSHYFTCFYLFLYTYLMETMCIILILNTIHIWIKHKINNKTIKTRKKRSIRKKPKMVILVILDSFAKMGLLTLFPSWNGFLKTPKTPIFDHF